jgi:hypothetical protein
MRARLLIPLGERRRRKHTLLTGFVNVGYKPMPPKMANGLDGSTS